MTENDETMAPAAEPAANPSTEAPAADLDLDALVAEYAQQTSDPKQLADPTQPHTVAERDYSAELRENMQSNRDLLELRLWAEGMQEERIARREHEDREAIFAEAADTLKDIEHLPADHAKRWLIAEANLDPELHHAWHSRYESGDAMRRCTSALRRAFTKMREQAKLMPDPEATADRDAVVASMTRGRSNNQPESPPPDLSKMSDHEFANYKEKIGL